MLLGKDYLLDFLFCGVVFKGTCHSSKLGIFVELGLFLASARPKQFDFSLIILET